MVTALGGPTDHPALRGGTEKSGEGKEEEEGSHPGLQPWAHSSCPEPFSTQVSRGQRESLLSGGVSLSPLTPPDARGLPVSQPAGPWMHMVTWEQTLQGDLY